MSLLGEGQFPCGVQQAPLPAAREQALLTGISSTYATLQKLPDFLAGAHYNVQHGHPALRISTAAAGKLSGFYSSPIPQEDSFCWAILFVRLFGFCKLHLGEMKLVRNWCPSLTLPSPSNSVNGWIIYCDYNLVDFVEQNNFTHRHMRFFHSPSAQAASAILATHFSERKSLARMW